MSSLDPDVIEWRERGLRGLLRFTAVVMGVALLVFLPRNVLLGRYLLAAVLTAATALIAIGAWVDRVSHDVRSALLAVTVLAVAAVAVINAQTWTPNSFVGMATVTIVLSVTHSARAAWLCLAASTAILIGLSCWFVFGRPLTLQDTSDVTLPLNWVRITALFGPATALGVISVSRLVRRLEAALQHNRQLLEREREQARRDTLSQEAQRLEALGRLAGGIAHDFNNVLLVVMANAELLARGAGDADARGLANEIRDASARGTELAKTLLTFGRAEAGGVGPVPSTPPSPRRSRCCTACSRRTSASSFCPTSRWSASSRTPARSARW